MPPCVMPRPPQICTQSSEISPAERDRNVLRSAIGPARSADWSAYDMCVLWREKGKVRELGQL